METRYKFVSPSHVYVVFSVKSRTDSFIDLCADKAVG